jgi:short-subunit dehydrogenase
MKNAIIFGATSGIGEALVRFLVEDGYIVVVAGRRIDRLQVIKEKYGESIIIKQNDITQVKELQSVFDEIVAELRTVDLVIQSSGIGYVNVELDWDKEEDTIYTNVHGVTKLYGLAMQLFAKQKFGHLVGISSIASIRGSKYAPAYFASKAYQKAYMESLYLKSPKSVYVTEIRPGYVDTKMALGDDIFWMVPVQKAAKQIYKAIKKRKRVAYISRRWIIIAYILKLVPAWLLKRAT